MKSSVIAFITFSVFGIAFATNVRRHQHVKRSDQETIGEISYNLVKEYIPEDVINNCNISHTFEVAVDEVVKNLDAIDITETTVCSLVETKVDDILKPLTTLLEECEQLNELGKVTETFVKAFSSAIKYICHSKGEQLLDILHPCIFEMFFTLSIDEKIPKEIEELFHRVWNYESQTRQLETIRNFCEVGVNIRDFFQKHMNCCLPSTKEYIIGFLDAFIAPCDNLK